MRWLSLDLLVDFGQVPCRILLYGHDMMCINRFVYIMAIITRHKRLKLVTENGAWKSKVTFKYIDVYSFNQCLKHKSLQNAEK